MQSPSEIPAVSYRSSEKHDLESQTAIVEKSLAVGAPSKEEEASSIKKEQPTRKQVWKKRWDSAVRQGWWPRVLYSGFGLIVGAIWIGITVYFSNTERKWSNAQQRQALQSNQRFGNLLLIFDGVLKKFDQSEKSLTVTWSGTFINFTDPTDPNSDYEEVPLDYPYFPGGASYSSPVDVYRDVKTTFLNLTDPNLDPSLVYHGYYWVIKNTSVPRIATIGNTADDNFDTDIDFQATGDSNVWRQPLFGYPLDQMTGNIKFVTSFADPSQWPFNFTTAVFNFGDARLKDYSFNWRFEIKTESICKSPEDYPEFNHVYNDTVSNWTFPCHLDIVFTATRPPLVQFAVAMAVIVNWTSTLFIFVLTCESLIMRRGWMLSGTDLLGVTFTSLFALPTIRMLLPGAPDFGVLIDLIGIIPNVIVISLCIVAIAVAKLNRTHKEEMKDKAE